MSDLSISDNEQQCLDRLLKIEAALHEDPPQPERKADAIRNIFFELHLSLLRKQNSNPSTSGTIAAKTFAKRYEDIVDSNNIQSVSEPDKWQAGLSIEEVSNLDCVKQLLRRCQAEAKLQTPSNMSQPLWPSVAAASVAAGSRVSSNAESLGHKPLFKTAASPAFREAAATPDRLSLEGCGAGEFHFQPTFKQSMVPFNAAGKSYKHPQECGKEPELRESIDGPADSRPGISFKTAKEQLMINQNKKNDNGASQMSSNYTYGSTKKSLGTRRGLNSRFVPPVLNRDDGSSDVACATGSSHRSRPTCEAVTKSDEPVDERLKGFEPKIVELITSEIMDHRPRMDWDDIAGLQFAKKTIQEIIVWPMLRPDIFTGLRGPPKGLLLFGPPGTGKTLIGKCIASQSKSTFFCISASSLTSKWVGEGEKMVRALFTIARCHQPAVIFIDEVDSLLSQRSDGEHESSRRIKTEFLVQLDGATTDSEDRILVIGATNRPQEIDEAARRRFVKRLYIPLPERVAREHIIRHLMSQQQCHLTDEDIVAVSAKTEGYSGADMANLCREAALGPIRSIPIEQMEYIHPEQVPPIMLKDFEAALTQVRPSVSDKDLGVYITWNNTYGSFGC